MKTSKGKVNTPVRMVLAGVEGIGKTTFASKLPNPKIIDIENGSLELDVNRDYDFDNINEVYESIKTSECDTLVIDSIDWYEKLLIKSMLTEYNKKSISDFPHGQGYVMLTERFAQFLDMLNDTNKHIVLVSHIEIKKYEAPDGMESYDRYTLKLSKRNEPLVKEWCSMHLFANYKTRVVEKQGKNKAIGGDERFMYTSRTAAWDAKNRYGLKDVLPFEPKEILHLFSSSAKSTPVSTDLVLESTPQSIYEILQDKWVKAGKTYENKQSAFQWLGVDSIDFQWDELNETQVKRLLEKL